MTELVDRYFRCPPSSCEKIVTGPLSENPGYFEFGDGIVCYARSSSVQLSRKADRVRDVSREIQISPGVVRLPFDTDEAVLNLLYERYARSSRHSLSVLTNRIARHTYYAVRPSLSLGIRSQFQKLYLHNWNEIQFPKWPVDTTVDEIMKKLLSFRLKSEGVSSIPFIWFWPDGAAASVIMTHDVEEEQGRQFCTAVMDLDDEFHIPASFQIVPERRYEVTADFLEQFKRRNFEVNVQDLYHDGRLFWNYEEFQRRVAIINQYGRSLGAKGFRAAILYRNQDWFNLLDFEYDMSVPNVAHLDPQRGGCCTVMPHFVGRVLELPVTTTQDHSIFHILNQYSLNLWQEQVEIILRHHGLVSFIIHPDYVIENRAREVFKRLLLELCKLRSDRNVWIAAPREVNAWWRIRDAMKLEFKDGEWVIEGLGKERARIAWASLDGEELCYNFSAPKTAEATYIRY